MSKIPPLPQISQAQQSPVPSDENRAGSNESRGIGAEFQLKHTAVTFDESKENRLGAGNFCHVYKGLLEMRKGQKRTVAIKLCHHPTQDDQLQDRFQEARLLLFQEAKLMCNYRHPNIVRFFGIACEHEPILLILEFCPGGSLVELLMKYHDISHQELILYCFEIARGCRYLHNMKTIHRDLAARNCLISAKGVIKIADFGLGKVIGGEPQPGEPVMKRIPIRWVAPECLTKHPVYSFSSDVWSFGVLAFEIFNKGIPPFDDETDFKAMRRRIRVIEMPPFPEGAPEIIVKLVKEKIWQKPRTRTNFVDIFAVLAEYIFENLSTFPRAKHLYINKIKGVERREIVTESKEDILMDDKDYHSSRNEASTTQKRSKEVRKRSRKVTVSKASGSTDNSVNALTSSTKTTKLRRRKRHEDRPKIKRSASSFEPT